MLISVREIIFATTTTTTLGPALEATLPPSQWKRKLFSPGEIW
jgi:hypothetical protein